jgi:3-dehydroquinate dehydratase I
MPLNLKKTELGTIPNIVAIIPEIMPEKELLDLAKIGITLLELRIDLIADNFENIETYLEKIKALEKFDIIATIRQTDKNKNERLEMFKKIMPLVDCIDIEVDTDIRNKVMLVAKEHNTKVIISYHDFNKMPRENELNNIVTQSQRMGADIIKIAAMANKEAEVLSLLDFTKKCPFSNIVTIAMGDLGSISRVVAPLFGSLFSYGHLKGSVAPGQLSLKELHEQLKTFYPKYKERTEALK